MRFLCHICTHLESSLPISDYHCAFQAYQQQLILCREDPRHKQLEASSYSSLGNCHREMKIFDKALGFHAQELQIQKELGNLQGECRAQASLGQTHTILGNFAEALRCFQAQLEKAKEVRSSPLEVQALTNVGITRLRLGHFDEALVTFQRQAVLLESVSSPSLRQYCLSSHEYLRTAKKFPWVREVK